MTGEELRELEIIIRDLRMAVEIKEQIDKGEERGLVNFADGERISMSVPEEAKTRLDAKIKQLSGMLKGKLARIKE